MVKPQRLPPVFVLSTGRCGSTMVSNILNLHPRVLSLSEFFSYVGVHQLFRARRSTGQRMWEFYSKQRKHTRLMLREPSYEEFLYPLEDSAARFSQSDVPPVMCAALPHITSEYEALFDELGPLVQSQPKQLTVDHLRYLFGVLCDRFGADTWVERSGGSLLFGSRLMREFPEARVVHVYRDGRDTAVSMYHHYLFRLIVVTLKKIRNSGVDPISLMYRRKIWDSMSPWLTPLVNMVIKPEKLPFDELKISDFAAFWNAMIAISDHLLSGLPAERLLNLKFEDMQAEPEVHIRRLIRFIDPSLEDEEWIREASSIPRPTRSRFANLSTADQDAVVEACWPGLKRLGYPV